MWEIFRDAIWQFIGALAGFLAIVIAIIVYTKQSQTKSLSYEITSNASLLSVAKEIEGELEIIYKGMRVKQVQLFEVKIINSGKIPIVKTDYEQPICLVLNEDCQILTAEISKVSPEYLETSATIEKNKIIIEPVLLNQDDFITVSSLISKFYKFRIIGRIAGVRKIEIYVRNLTKSWLIFLGSIAINIIYMVGLLTTGNFWFIPIGILAVILIFVGPLKGYPFPISTRARKGKKVAQSGI